MDVHEQKVELMRIIWTRRSWRALTDTLVSSMLIQTTLMPRYMQNEKQTPKFFQSTMTLLTKPGKIGEVALRVRILQNWANKIAGRKDEWKKEESA